jgi:hypothetical protein
MIPNRERCEYRRVLGYEKTGQVRADLSDQTYVGMGRRAKQLLFGHIEEGVSLRSVDSVEVSEMETIGVQQAHGHPILLAARSDRVRGVAPTLVVFCGERRERGQGRYAGEYRHYEDRCPAQSLGADQPPAR